VVGHGANDWDIEARQGFPASTLLILTIRLGSRKVTFSAGDLVRLEYLEFWRVPHSRQGYISPEGKVTCLSARVDQTRNA